jgi:hypothetical protein
MAVCFSIPGWKAWHLAHDNLQPDVSLIPAMLRRRLSPMGRAAFSVMIPLVETFGPMPLVYVSRHGEVGRTMELLAAIAKQEPLSPTAFSLSVHNAIAGLFSIHQGITKNINAIASGSQELVAALLEAVGLCSEQEPRVLCVFCDEPLPSVYSGFVSQPQAPYALAVVISIGNDWQLTPTIDQSVNFGEPQALSLLRLLQLGEDRLLLAVNKRSWQLERVQG